MVSLLSFFVHGIFDSGALEHMTGFTEYLHNLHSYHGNQKIKIVDGNTLSITIVGDVNSTF